MSPLTERQKEIIRKKIKEAPNKSDDEIAAELDFPCPMRAIAALRRGIKKRELVGEIAEMDQKVSPRESSLMHPPHYVEVQIRPVIRSNDMMKEVVWTYLVARKYENDHKTLCKLLCGQNEEMPFNSKIWLEAYLYPTRVRQEEVQYWRSRADLSMGHLELGGFQDIQWHELPRPDALPGELRGCIVSGFSWLFKSYQLRRNF